MEPITYLWYNDPMDTITLFTTNLEAISIALASVVGLIGILIMAYGALKSAAMFIHCHVKRVNRLPTIRIELGKHLSLGLEFLVGKDIIQSIIEPTWDQLGKLAAIIVLRTLVTLFLMWELKEAESELK